MLSRNISLKLIVFNIFTFCAYLYVYLPLTGLIILLGGCDTFSPCLPLLETFF